MVIIDVMKVLRFDLHFIYNVVHELGLESSRTITPIPTLTKYSG